MSDERKNDAAVETQESTAKPSYKPEANDIEAGMEETARQYKAEQEQRKAEYQSGPKKISSSYEVLKEVPVVLYEKPDQPARPPSAPEAIGDKGREKGALSGRASRTNPDGSTIFMDDKGRIESTVDVTGATHSFGYGADGKVNSVKDSEHQWTSTDGKHWVNEAGEAFDGTVDLAKDGSLAFQNEKGAVIMHLDGRTEKMGADNSLRVVDRHGRIERTTDAAGRSRAFGYGADGQLTSVTEEDGSRWSTTDGKTWTTPEGRTWVGSIKVENDGTYRYVDDKAKETIKKPDGTTTVKEVDGRITDTLPDGTDHVVRKPFDREKLNDLAERLHGDERGMLGASDMMEEDNRKKMTWNGEAFDRLNSLSADEREALKGIYHQKYGHSLQSDYSFLKGEDKEKLDKLMTKSDDPVAARADKLMNAIDKSREDYNWYSYRNTDRTGNANDDVRLALASMTSEEIKQVDDYYKRVYGTSLQSAIKVNTPETTSEMSAIYLKGKDKLTTEDYDKLYKLQEAEKIKIEGVPDTELTSEDVKDWFDDHFTELDRDEDGFVSEDEINRAMKNSDNKGKDAQFIAMLKDEHKKLQKLSDDEVGSEDDGVTKKDIAKLDKLASKENRSEDEEKIVSDVDGDLQGAGKRLKGGSRNLWGPGDDPKANICPEAIDQNEMGDCFFMASVCALANTDEGKKSIKDMIEDNGDGTYTVTFAGDPKHPVTIDEPNQVELARGAGTKHGMWVAVLEKAYGKYQDKHSDKSYSHSSDSINDGGQGEDALKLLTGREVDRDELRWTSRETTHEKLKAAMSEGRPVVASTPHEFGEDSGLADGLTDGTGIPTAHQYTVLDYDPETRMVKLRNPWGSGEPKFKARKMNDPNDGVFEMTLDEFHKEFEDVDYTQRA